LFSDLKTRRRERESRDWLAVGLVVVGKVETKTREENN
jgi:hypothetical protein